MTGRTSRPLPEQDLAGVALQQEGLGDEESVEHLDDVAVLEDVLRPARTGMIPVPQRLRLDDLELRERRAVDGLRTEEPHRRAAGLQDADDLVRQRLGG